MPKRRHASRCPDADRRRSAAAEAGAQSGLLGPAGLAAWEENSEAVIRGLLARGVEPRFLIQWFSLFEVVERGDPLLIGAINAAM